MSALNEPRQTTESVMPPVVIEANNISKTFGDAGLSVDVLQGIDLRVAASSSASIIGASGSGKSTLLHILGGLEKPDTGEVIVSGQHLSTMNERQRGDIRNRSLGFIYQFHHLLAEFSALENVAMPLFIRGIDKEQAYAEAELALRQVGLSKRVQHRPAELSGGERQRTAIARATVTRPQCILADEPTGNLDRKTADGVFDVLLSLKEQYQTSLIIVTHDNQLAERTECQFLLENGQLS